MNKLELIKAIQNENGLSRKEAAAVIDIFFDEMMDTLSKSEMV